MEVFKSYKWMDGLDGLDWILLRSLVLLEHLAVLTNGRELAPTKIARFKL